MMTRRTATVAVLAFPLAAGAAVAAHPNPAAVDVDVEALQDVLDGWRNDVGAFGATLSLRVPDRDDVHLASGVDDRDPETPMPIDGTFPIDKVTMNFVGVLALQLVDEGRLALDDTIEEWLPEIPEADQITVEMLLTHTSGIAAWRDAPDYYPMLIDNMAHVFSPDEVLAATLAMPRTHAPGETFAWSDGGFVALGLLIERELGQNLATVLTERITDPLGLDDTVLSSDYSEVTRHGWFATDGDPQRPLDGLDFPGNAAATSQWASGGMVSSATDLLDWNEALYSGGLLGPETTAAMLEMRTTWLGGLTEHQHGLGITGYCLRPEGCELGDVELLGYAGFFAGGSGVRVAYHPATGTSMVVHANINPIDTGPFLTLATAILDTLGVGSGADSVPPDVLTLRMGTPYNDVELQAGTGSRYTPAVFEFVSELKRLSGGALDVVPVFQAADGSGFNLQADGEHKMVQGVIDGEFDIGWAGTRVFDTFDVTSFQALHVPFLVDSYQLQQAILDSDLPGEMLAGLDAIGLEGLAVLGGGLRKPIGREGPLLSPDDFAGITFQLYRSNVQAAAVTALGATPTDVVAGVRDAGLSSGEIDGHEHSLRTYVARGNTTFAPYVTANVNLWAETVALIANPDAMTALTPQQREWLREAAAIASARSVALYDNEADLLVSACAQGATVVEASDDDLAALRQAVEPVYAELRGDAQTAELIDRIEELKGEVPAEAPPIPDGCSGEGESVASATVPTTGALQGLFRSEPVTMESAAVALAARGLPESAAAEFFRGYGETGTFTLRIEEARYVLTESYDGGPESVGGAGSFELVDDNTVILTPDGYGPVPIEYEYDGTTLTLRIALEDAEIQQIYAAIPEAANFLIYIEAAEYTLVE